MIHVWRMVTENCVWRKILNCCVWRLNLIHCGWRVISKHCVWHQPKKYASPQDASQTQCFEFRRLMQDFKTLCLTPARCQPDAMFRNQASDAKFQNHASDVIFCDHASDGQYESSYVVHFSRSFLQICPLKGVKFGYYLGNTEPAECPL